MAARPLPPPVWGPRELRWSCAGRATDSKVRRPARQGCFRSAECASGRRRHALRVREEVVVSKGPAVTPETSPQERTRRRTRVPRARATETLGSADSDRWSDFQPSRFEWAQESTEHRGLRQGAAFRCGPRTPLRADTILSME